MATDPPVLYQQFLAQSLAAIQHYDTLAAQELDDGVRAELYLERNALVYRCLHLATWLHLPAGIKLDPAEPHWPVAYLELPQGQVSWHLEEYHGSWDGHSTSEKYQRVQAYSLGAHRDLGPSIN